MFVDYNTGRLRSPYSMKLCAPERDDMLDFFRLSRRLAFVLLTAANMLCTPSLFAFEFDDPIGEVLDGLEDTGNRLIASAEASADRLLLQAATEANYAIYATRLAYFDSLDKSADKLTTVQKQAMVDLDRTMNNAIAQGVDGAAAAAQSLDRLSRTLRDIVGKHRPFLQSTTPNFVAAGLVADSHLNVCLRGLDLAGTGGTAPTLKIDKATLTPSRTSDTELLYRIPTGMLANTEKFPVALRGSLSIPYVEPRLLGADKKRDAQYEFLLFLAPEALGTYKVTPQIIEAVIDVKERKMTSKDAKYSAKCKGRGCKPQRGKPEWCFANTPGYNIDPSSVKAIKVAEHSTKGTGYAYTSSCGIYPAPTESTVCMQMSAVPFGRGDQHTVWCGASWRETKTKDQRKTAAPITGQLSYRQPAYVVSLPANSDGFVTEISYFGKFSKPFLRPGEDKYVAVDWEPSTKVVSIALKNDVLNAVSRRSACR